MCPLCGASPDPLAEVGCGMPTSALRPRAHPAGPWGGLFQVHSRDTGACTARVVPAFGLEVLAQGTKVLGAGAGQSTGPAWVRSFAGRHSLFFKGGQQLGQLQNRKTYN